MESKNNPAAKVKLGWGKAVFILFALLAAGYYGNLFMPRVSHKICYERVGCHYLTFLFRSIPDEMNKKLTFLLFTNGENLHRYIENTHICQKAYDEIKQRGKPLNAMSIENCQLHQWPLSPATKEVMDEWEVFEEKYNNQSKSFRRYFVSVGSERDSSAYIFGFFNRFSSYVALLVIALGAVAFSRYATARMGWNAHKRPVQWKWLLPLAGAGVAGIYTLDAAFMATSLIITVWLVAFGGVAGIYIWLSKFNSTLNWKVILLEFVILQMLLIGLIKGNHYTYCAQYTHEPALFQNFTQECMEKE